MNKHVSAARRRTPLPVPRKLQQLTLPLVIAAIAVIGTVALLQSRAATQWRVMPVGDSITDGFRIGGGCYLTGTDSTTAYQGGYRIPLGQKFASGEILYVGPHSNGPTNMNGGTKHAGACGAWIGGAIEEPNNTTNSIWQRMDWQNYPSYTPHFVLLHIGTNDSLHSSSGPNAAADRLSALVDKFSVKLPNTHIIVATIVSGSNIGTYNERIRTMVPQKKAQGKKVYLADLANAGLICSADFRPGDCVHPDDSGYAKMANAWYPVMKTIIDGGGNVTPPSPGPVTPPPPPPAGQISQVNNLASGKTFTSSAPDHPTEPGNPVTNVNDRNEDTRWISAAQDNTILATDLGTAYTLNKISVLWAGNTIRNYDLQVSTNNSTWTTVASGTTNNTQKQLIDTTSFTSTPTGRYFRILAKDRWNTGYGNSIWEIGVYGTTATTPPPPPPVGLPGDVNGDSRVNALDLSALISRDGQNYPAADFNSDGTVGAADMAILLSRWTW